MLQIFHSSLDSAWERHNKIPDRQHFIQLWGWNWLKKKVVTLTSIDFITKKIINVKLPGRGQPDTAAVVETGADLHAWPAHFVQQDPAA